MTPVAAVSGARHSQRMESPRASLERTVGLRLFDGGVGREKWLTRGRGCFWRPATAALVFTERYTTKLPGQMTMLKTDSNRQVMAGVRYSEGRSSRISRKWIDQRSIQYAVRMRDGGTSFEWTEMVTR